VEPGVFVGVGAVGEEVAVPGEAFVDDDAHFPDAEGGDVFASGVDAGEGAVDGEFFVVGAQPEFLVAAPDAGDQEGEETRARLLATTG
jgi:hypothetical protein